LTVKKDLDKAVAAAQSAKGTYAVFATATDDPTAQTMFEQMSQDLDRHIAQINSRLSMVAENKLNDQEE
jgi:rubrerythrin